MDITTKNLGKHTTAVSVKETTSRLTPASIVFGRAEEPQFTILLDEKNAKILFKTLAAVMCKKYPNYCNTELPLMLQSIKSK